MCVFCDPQDVEAEGVCDLCWEDIENSACEHNDVSMDIQTYLILRFVPSFKIYCQAQAWIEEKAKLGWSIDDIQSGLNKSLSRRGKELAHTHRLELETWADHVSDRWLEEMRNSK